jgi:hypothetical protein
LAGNGTDVITVTGNFTVDSSVAQTITFSVRVTDNYSGVRLVRFYLYNGINVIATISLDLYTGNEFDGIYVGNYTTNWAYGYYYFNNLYADDYADNGAYFPSYGYFHMTPGKNYFFLYFIVTRYRKFK